MQKDNEIQNINANKSNTFIVGHNFMSTWTEDEYVKLLGSRGRASNGIEVMNPTILDDNDIPTSIDWRSKGMINAVKDQG